MIEKLYKIREDNTNIILLNYLSMIYLFSMMVSSKISGTIIYIMIIIFFFNTNFKIHISETLKNKFVQACLLYILVILIWMIGSEDLSYAIVQLKINRFYILPLLFFSIIRTEFFNKYVYVFLLGALVNVIWTSILFLNIIDGDYNNFLIMQVDQSFLIFMAISFIMFSMIKKNISFKENLFSFVLILLFTVNIFFLKKTAMVSYLIIIFLLVIYIYRKNILKIFIIFIIFSFSFMVIINYIVPHAKEQLVYEYVGVQKAFSENDYTRNMSARLGVAKFSVEAILEKPFFGYGTGNHSFAVKNKLDESKLNNLISSTSYEVIRNTLETGKHSTLHNTFLMVLVQYGIIGFIIFLGIFYQFARYIAGEINIYSGLILVMLINAFLQFNSGWDFQFGNYGKLYIFTAVLLIKMRINNLIR